MKKQLIKFSGREKMKSEWAKRISQVSVFNVEKVRQKNMKVKTQV